MASRAKALAAGTGTDIEIEDLGIVDDQGGNMDCCESSYFLHQPGCFLLQIDYWHEEHQISTNSDSEAVHCSSGSGSGSGSDSTAVEHLLERFHCFFARPNPVHSTVRFACVYHHLYLDTDPATSATALFVCCFLP
jgi:hypothetical protein